MSKERRTEFPHWKGNASTALISPNVPRGSIQICFVGRCRREGSSNVNSFVTDALSTYLVLRNIFVNLQNNDLDSCCQVNKCWNDVAKLLFVRYVDVTLQDSYGFAPSIPTVIAKLSLYGHEGGNLCEYSLADASKLLDADMKHGSIAIRLLYCCGNENEEVCHFLSKYGKLIEAISIETYVTARKCLELFARYFPNLRYLDLTKTDFDTREQAFDKTLLENCMKHLNRIDFGTDNLSLLTATNILRMSPNLKEVHNFPVTLIDALIDSQKVACVKSLLYPATTRDEMFLTAFKELSSIGVNLHSFSFEFYKGWRGEILSNTTEQVFLERILLASRDSLLRLTLHKTGTFGFKGIQPMNSLKEIQFIPPLRPTRGDPMDKFFSSDVVLSHLFPNVSAVAIKSLINSTGGVKNLFPEDQFTPWGLQVKHLKLPLVSVDILQMMGRLFPSVKGLEFRIRGVQTSNLRGLLPEIGKHWPELESLTVTVGPPPLTIDENEHQQCSFDSVFTGLPDDIVAQLGDPHSRWGFSPDAIVNFKAASTLRKLQKLKTLIFDLQSGGNSDLLFMEKLSAVTSVSKDFGFQFLPEMKIIVRTRLIHEFKQVSAIKNHFAPLVNFGIEQLK